MSEFDKTKTYVAYKLEKKKDKYNPPLDVQITYIKESFKRRYGREAEDVFVGPIKSETQVYVPEDCVYVPLPSGSNDLEGFSFTTGYR